MSTTKPIDQLRVVPVLPMEDTASFKPPALEAIVKNIAIAQQAYIPGIGKVTIIPIFLEENNTADTAKTESNINVRMNIPRATVAANAFNPARIHHVHESQKPQSHYTNAKPLAHEKPSSSPGSLPKDKTTPDTLLKLLTEMQREQYATKIDFPKMPPAKENPPTECNKPPVQTAAFSVEKPDSEILINPLEVLEQCTRVALPSEQRTVLQQMKEAISLFENELQNSVAVQNPSPTSQPKQTISPFFSISLPAANIFLEKTVLAFVKIFAEPKIFLRQLPQEAQLVLQKTIPALLLFAQIVKLEKGEQILHSKVSEQILEKALAPLLARGHFTPFVEQVFRNIIQNQTLINILIPYLHRQEKLAYLRKKKRKKGELFLKEDDEDSPSDRERK